MSTIMPGLSVPLSQTRKQTGEIMESRFLSDKSPTPRKPRKPRRGGLTCQDCELLGMEGMLWPPVLVSVLEQV